MLGVITRIHIAKSNEKIEIMKENPGMKRVFEYAYNPFKKYYMKAPELDGLPDSNFYLDESFEILDDLYLKKISGQAAFEKVCDCISIMYEDNAEIFKMILNKDLRCGINITSINKAFPGLIPLTFDGSEKPDIMLLKNFDIKKTKFPLLGAVKKDGVRGLCTGNMISRSGHKLIGHDHIEKELSQYPHFFDGELCVPGLCFDNAAGLIKNKKPCPESVYWVFDAPSVPGTKKERYEWLVNNLIETDCVKLITHFTIGDMSAKNDFYKWALKAGEEGIVVYDPNSLYEDKRSYDWMREVPLKKADCRVVGFFEGKGKHSGSLGGIVVDYKGHEVKVGTGFKEKIEKEHDKNSIILNNPNLAGSKYQNIVEGLQNIRQYIWDNQDLFVGAIAESEFKEETKAGSMRQPRFKNWRWDKMIDTTKNICDTCLHEYADCGADNIRFGDGTGGDNIWKCDCYLDNKI